MHQTRRSPDRARRWRFQLLWFSITLFTSAGLLFLVQPMVGQMILPMLGGTPSVWNACMLFFQAMLLAGYCFAHVSSRILGVRRQSLVQLALAASPILLLPIAMNPDGAVPTNDNPVFWLLGRLCLSVGLPFFVVSTMGPVLQKWFAHTDHPSAGDPYFLYAASNAGSLLALLAYPFLLQPSCGLTHQSALWSVIYCVFTWLLAGCAVLLWRAENRSRKPAHAIAAAPAEAGRSLRSAPAPTTGERAWWVATAFVPSSLMLGVTTHITTNLAPVPLLWILPLSVYLLTFILVFARRSIVPAALMSRLLPMLVIPAGVTLFVEMDGLGGPVIVLHLVVFFVAAMVCHQALASSRPDPEHLTEFYLLMAVGGALGGFFNAILAPMLFDSVAEYPLAMVLACMFVRGRGVVAPRTAWQWSDLITPAAMGAGFILVAFCIDVGGLAQSRPTWLAAFAAMLAVLLLTIDRPLRFGLGYGVFLLASAYHLSLSHGDELLVERNFFGVKRVVVDGSGKFRLLFHGSTIHGAQTISTGDMLPEPLAYYHRTGPVGDCFKALVERKHGNSRVAVVGLGAGAVAAYAGPRDHFTFYEIDPAIERIARDTRYFSFLERCRGSYDVVLGDGRLTLATAPDGRYDMIILDAFSSDAVPAHLLTREAVSLYMSKLAPEGLLVFQASNKYLNITDLIGALADDAGLACLYRDDRTITRAQKNAGGKQPSIYAVIARDAVELEPLAASGHWVRITPPSDLRVWTDHYSNLLALLR